MKRREFITLLGGAAAGWPVAARAQQPTMPVIGFLGPTTADVLSDRVRGLQQGLKETGFSVGENLNIVFRLAENRDDRLPDLAADLVRRQVTVIVAASPRAAFAAKAATTKIPIVFLIGDDPVRLGLVPSIARPDGNLTGINFLGAELVGKRAELLRELLPGATRLAVLANPADLVTENQVRAVQAAATSIGLEIKVANATTSREIDGVFDLIGRERPDALFVTTSAFLNNRRIQLVQLAAFHRLAATYGLRDFAEAGGLMSYGSSIVDAYRQCGLYVGRIMNGARTADLPVLQASKFELIINSQTARMLGLTVPPTLLTIADEVIE
jgi:putative ABC transport system substrate-binding protein